MKKRKTKHRNINIKLNLTTPEHGTKDISITSYRQLPPLLLLFTKYIKILPCNDPKKEIYIKRVCVSLSSDTWWKYSLNCTNDVLDGSTRAIIYLFVWR